jgi:hypothetical protein
MALRRVRWRLSLDTRRQIGIMRLVLSQKHPAKICFYARLAAIMLTIAREHRASAPVF